MNHVHWTQPDIVIVGPLNVDLIIKGSTILSISQINSWNGPSQVHLRAAGAAGYVAQDMAKLGTKLGILSTIGDDTFGNEIEKVLKSAGIDISRLRVETQTETCIAIYMLLFGSKKRPLTYRLPTHSPWPVHFSSEDLDYLFSARHLHCAGYLHYPQMWNDEMAKVFLEARKRGLSTSLDPQFALLPVDIPWKEPLAELLKVTDNLLLDEKEARLITQMDDLHAAAGWFQESGVKTVVIKRGAMGSIIHTEKKEFEIPALPVPTEEIVEEIGAGDAYDAGFLHGLLSGWTTELCAAFATATATSTLRGSGGSDALATIDQILQDVKRIIPRL
jgi:2-dehydro-3-deoxygluconokinase